MGKHFNGLSPAEAERLALLIEECGEIVQIACKVLRHGYESYHPDDIQQTTNRQLLEKELGDLDGAYTLMVKAGDVRMQAVSEARTEKLENVGEYLHHQGQR